MKRAVADSTNWRLHVSRAADDAITLRNERVGRGSWVRIRGATRSEKFKK
jgi:hypothetical protein